MNNGALVFTLSALTLIGEVGQVIWLPLWLDSTRMMTLLHFNHGVVRGASGSYGVLLISSIAGTLIYGLLFLAFGKIKGFRMTGHLSVALAMNALGSLLTPFLSSSSRNNPVLQAILFNSYVPATVIIRMFMLKRLPTRRKFVCVCLVVLGLSICLVPDITMDTKQINQSHAWNDESGEKSAALKALYSLGFILCSVLPATIMSVCEEKFLKGSENQSEEREEEGEGDQRGSLLANIEGKGDEHRKNLQPTERPDILCVSFVMSLVQLAVVLLFFWIDLIPYVGFSHNIKDFTQMVKKTFLCTVTGEDCRPESLGFACGFIISSVMSLISGSYLVLKAEGSTFWALVVNLVTPSAVVFWILFRPNPLRWSPHFESSSWFSIVAIVVMLPAVIIYNFGNSENSFVWVKTERKLCGFDLYKMRLLNPTNYPLVP